MQTSQEPYLFTSLFNPNLLTINMGTKQKIYVFDLDDTLIQTTKYDPEFWKHDFSHLMFFKNAEKVLGALGPENCILLTYDEHGLQNEKIERLGLREKFKEIHVVKDKIEKFIILRNLKQKVGSEKEIVVIGDKHVAGELQYGKALGLKTVCIAMDGGFNYDKIYHRQYDLTIESENDYLKLLELE